MPKEGPRECGLSIGRRGDISRPLILIPAHSLLPFCKCQNRTALSLCAVALGRGRPPHLVQVTHSLCSIERDGGSGEEAKFCPLLCAPHSLHRLSRPYPPTYRDRRVPPSSPSFPFPPARTAARSFPKISPTYAVSPNSPRCTGSPTQSFHGDAPVHRSEKMF